MRFKVIATEDYVARDKRMVDQGLQDVAVCDIYVGVFAWRYGYIPPEGNPQRLSVTELEYREAEAKKKPRLVFLLDANAPWPPTYMDSSTGENDRGARIVRLREELSQPMYSPFNEPGDLAVAVAAAVHLTAADARTQSLSVDLSSASCLTMMSSTAPGIITNISRAIVEDVKADVIKVNLGKGMSWWSTRLHLLSALCADYTEVRQIVFEAEGYCVMALTLAGLLHREARRAGLELSLEALCQELSSICEIVNLYAPSSGKAGRLRAATTYTEPTPISSHLVEIFRLNDWKAR